jgi:tetratricopeptide (TPR) repeat protein
MLAHQGDLERAAAFFTATIRLARLLGDPRALWDAHVCRHAMVTGRACSAADFAARRHELDEGLAAAVSIGEFDAVLEMELWRVAGFLEMGDHDAFEASLTHYGELSEKYQLSNFTWGLRCANTMRAMLHGEFSDAERLANHAYESGSEAHGELATGVYGVQMFTIRREQGRLAEVAPVVRRFVDENPGDAAWRPGLALIASDLGFAEAARKTFDEMAVAGFALPADAKRGLTLSYLAEVCARLGDATRAEWLYQALLPYRDNTIIAPVATVCCGAAARYLGMLASTMEDWSLAEEHFEAALALDEQLRAWPWLAHTQYEFAAALQRRGRIDDLARAHSLLAAALKTAERLGMLTLQKQIGSLHN